MSASLYSDSDCLGEYSKCLYHLAYSPAFMTKTIASVFRESWTFTQKNIALLGVGAVFCGMLAGVIQWQTSARVQDAMGYDQQVMEQLAARARAGDESAQEEMMKVFFGGTIPQTEEEAKEMMSKKMMTTFYAIAPVLAASLVATLLLLNFAAAYFWLVALKLATQTQDAFLSAIRSLPNMIALSMWIFLRTFMWVPILGVGFAIYFFPRLIQAPIYLLEGKKGAIESVRLSINGTRGMWWKVFKVQFVVWIFCVLMSVILDAIASSVLPIPFVSGLLSYCIVAFTAVCTCVLGKSTMKA